MEDFLREGLEGNDLPEFNICRILLKTTCLSDISTRDEISIRITEWDGIKNNVSSRYEWKIVPKPNKNMWGNGRRTYTQHAG